MIANFTETDFELAKSNPNLWLVAESDNGGVFLFCTRTCNINCSLNDVVLLITVLESIVWNVELSPASKASNDCMINLTDVLDNNGLPLLINDCNPVNINGVWIGSDSEFEKFANLKFIIRDYLKSQPSEDNPKDLFEKLKRVKHS